MFEFFSRIWGGEGRSPKWPAFRSAFLQGKSCEACGTSRDLEAHHIIPFHTPEGKTKELDSGNLIALCRDCHFTLGHLRSWSSWNTTVRQDSAWYLAKVKNRP